MASPASRLTTLAPAQLWVGLKNSNDKAAAFDLRVELARNGEPVTSGVARCVTGLARQPASVAVAFDSFPAISVEPGDVFYLRISNRMGTNTDDSKCNVPGTTHTSAVGLRLYYDSAGHDSHFDATITPKPAVSYFLHSDGTGCSTAGPGSSGLTRRFLDDSAPETTSDKCSESASGNSGGTNSWKEIGTWILTKS
jgi:hypothetical protein